MNMVCFTSRYREVIAAMGETRVALLEASNAAVIAIRMAARSVARKKGAGRPRENRNPSTLLASE